jgi:hypothetical protein
MKISAIGRGSISSFLKVVVDIAWVLSCAALGFIWIVTIVSLIAMSGGGHSMGVFESVVIENAQQLSVWTFSGTVFCVGAMVLCSYLRGVFETLVAGDPFVPQNARRFTMIALVLAVMEAVRMFIGLVVQVLLGVFGVTGKDPVSVSFSVNLPMWFSVLTLLVLAQVFREGAALREEQKMTI